MVEDNFQGFPPDSGSGEEPLPAENTPEILTGKKEKRKKKKEKKCQGVPKSTIAAVFVISAVISCISGSLSSYMVFTHLPAENKQETHGEIAGMADVETLPPSTDVPNTFMPTTPPVSETETKAEAKPLTKGDIYSEAVESIYAIKSEYNKVYSSIFGQTYAPVTSTGTGFAISDSGYIITNYHVIENGEKITITTYEGENYPATVVGSEPNNDVAVLKIDTKTVPVTFGSSASLKVGDDIMVIGNALGELSYTFTDGIVSHLSRAVTIDPGKTINMFQTNAAINAGNSGGPVYNMNGEVVGIASAKYASESVEGLGFCIPIDDVDDMILEIILYGYVQNKPSMGVSLQTVTSSMSLRYRIPTGCYVVAVAKNSAGFKAGLRAGDVITEINGHETTGCESVEKIMSELTAGTKINIKYTRDGTETETNTILDEYKPSEPRTSYTNVHDF